MKDVLRIDNDCEVPMKAARIVLTVECGYRRPCATTVLLVDRYDDVLLLEYVDLRCPLADAGVRVLDTVAVSIS